MATDKEFWKFTAVHLRAGADAMRASWERNIDKDATNIVEAKNAPANSDLVESLFAIVDGGKRLGSGPGANVGVAHATGMHAIDSSAARQASARADVQKRVKQHPVPN